MKKRKVMAAQTVMYLLKAKRRVELLGADHLEDQQKKRVSLVDPLSSIISMKSRFYSSAHSWFCTICYQAFYYKESLAS